MKRFILWTIAFFPLFAGAIAAVAAPLELQEKFPLGTVQGRLDHLAVDLPSHRLFVAELGNDSVGVMDVTTGRILARVHGLKAPQGVAYLPSTDTLYVANAGNGSVALFRGPTFAAAGTIPLGDDADNIRIDRDTGLVYVGFGDGGLAVIDPEKRAVLNRIHLTGHPESFQLEALGARIFVNVPDDAQIAVVDRLNGAQLATWPTVESHANFPMTIDAVNRRVLTVFRNPARLIAFDMDKGDRVAEIPVCGDSDDVFADSRRNRIYVACGDGHIDVLEALGTGYRQLARLTTSPGARTALFVPEWDSLFLAVRATDQEPAAIWAYRPEP
jgi:DNA-binding beta-propeller fold protein YncE